MKLRELLENIFSVKDYGETHHIMRVMGLKFKFPKAEYAKKRKENPYYYYKKNNIDITTLPPAEGQIRDIQLANLALLKEMDYVCQQAGLKYWLDFGTLLGAVRHKGYIPWDDDIDTGMLREDYDRIIEAFEKYSRNPDIYVDYINSAKNTCQCYLKVLHKKCSHLFVDIFPYDYYGAVLTREEQREKTLEIKELRKRMQAQSKSKEIKEVLSFIEQGRNEVIQRGEFVENSDLVWGVDFNHGWKNWFASYETIFPLGEVDFEGGKFPCANKTHDYLTEVFGDYMAYPKKIGIGHSMFAKLTQEEKENMEQLIKG